MHPHRRRKKKPSYGVRTVEVSRGKSGYGFTISGQAPCILSCIITGSPAEKAGLRAGDFLIAVNGQNVSKALHDDVVEVIGNSAGVLKLQIAENYYSDSSEDDLPVNKLRLKYSHKLKHRQVHSSVSRAEKVVHDLHTGALFDDLARTIPVLPKSTAKVDDTCTEDFCFDKPDESLLGLVLHNQVICDKTISDCGFWNGPVIPPSGLLGVNLPSNKFNSEHLSSRVAQVEASDDVFEKEQPNHDLCSVFFTEHDNRKYCLDQVVIKAVVGYLGTIEMPKEPQLRNSRLQSVRNCIRRLRVEKKVHTLVLMAVFPKSIVLINPAGLVLAEFCAEKIAFSGVYSDDKKFFGLVTTHGLGCDKLVDCLLEDVAYVSSSCHVFMVDPKLAPHHYHVSKAEAFKFTCTLDPVTNGCKEFPESADLILKGMANLYRTRMSCETACNVELPTYLSPQPSNSSSNSSNTDSGIGFKDEENSDRIFVESCCQFGASTLNRQAISISATATQDANLYSQDSHVILPSSSECHSCSENVRKNCVCSGFRCDRLTVRVMPDPVGFQKSPENIDVHDASADRCMQRITHLSSEACGKHCHHLCVFAVESEHFNGTDVQDLKETRISSDSVSNRRLSPKVYDFSLPCNLPNVCSEREAAANEDWEFFICTEDMESKENGSGDFIHSVYRQFVEQEHSVPDFAVEVEKKVLKTLSVRRYFGHKRNLFSNSHEAGTVSDGELAAGKFCNGSLLRTDHTSDTSLHSSCTSERSVNVGRVTSWATGFSSLLKDPAGLQAFYEFLRMEFSQENIAFWTACEDYRQLTSKGEMSKAAHKIFQKHLCAGATEPVNVDSHARRIAEEGLDFPTSNMFLPAQKQIFNLMKFDCYQRFLKSSVFKESILCEMRGEPLPYQGHIFSDRDPGQRKETKEVVEEKKRKSLFLWNRSARTKSSQTKTIGINYSEMGKSLKKRKRKGKAKDNQKFNDTSSTRSDETSRSSFTGSDPGMESLPS